MILEKEYIDGFKYEGDNVYEGSDDIFLIESDFYKVGHSSKKEKLFKRRFSKIELLEDRLICYEYNNSIITIFNKKYYGDMVEKLKTYYIYNKRKSIIGSL